MHITDHQISKYYVTGPVTGTARNFRNSKGLLTKNIFRDLSKFRISLSPPHTLSETVLRACRLISFGWNQKILPILKFIKNLWLTSLIWATISISSPFSLEGFINSPPPSVCDEPPMTTCGHHMNKSDTFSHYFSFKLMSQF